MPGPEKARGGKVSRMAMTETFELSINSKYEFVDKVSSMTKVMADRITFDEDTAGWIDLAVREAVINAIKHGNKSLEAKKVDVKFIVEPGSLTVLVRDRGEGFDPSGLPDPLDPAN